MAPTQPSSVPGTGVERLRLAKGCKQGQATPALHLLWCCGRLYPRGWPPGSCWAFWFLDRLGCGYGPVVQLQGPVPSPLCGIMVSRPGWLLWRDKRTVARGLRSYSGTWRGGPRVINSPQHGGLNRPLPRSVYYPRGLLAVL